MGLSKEEQATLDALVAKSQEDDDEDFEIEIWSGQDGARVPFKRGKAWFEKTFGIDIGSADEGKTPPRKRAQAKADPAKSDDDGTSEPTDGATVLRHFGRKAS